MYKVENSWKTLINQITAAKSATAHSAKNQNLSNNDLNFLIVSIYINVIITLNK